MTIEYDGIANIGYLGMNSSVDPTGAWSKRIQMSRDGTEVAFMAGNVGIGTTAPTAKLNVYLGSFSNTNTATAGVLASGSAGVDPGHAGYRIVLNNSTANYAGFVRGVRTSGTTFIGLEVGSETNHGIRFLTNGTADSAEKMRIDSSGNVGIGATGPEQKLEVGGNILASSSASALLNLVANNESDANFSLKVTGTSGSVARFSVLGSGSTEFLTVASSGNVGIGTTEPGAFLQVNTNVDKATTATTDVARFSSSDATGALQLVIQAYTHATGSSRGMIINSLEQGGSSRDLILQTGATSVGIGATNPGEKLEVGGNIMASSSASALLNLVANNESDANFSLKVTGTYGSVARFSILGSGSTEFLTVASSGNVGIGTTSPGVKLDVLGYIRSTGGYGIVGDSGTGKLFLYGDNEGSVGMTIFDN